MATAATAWPAASNVPYVGLFHDYSGKRAVLDAIHQTFLEGIEIFAGRACRERCEQAGLAGMHVHFPAESVGLLETFVRQRMKRRVLEWTAAIGRHNVGFDQDFLVEDLLVVRVHYPHSQIGKPFTATTRPRLDRRIRYGLSSALERMRDAYDSRTALGIPVQQVLEYARQRRKRAALPLPYRCHAPHLDSWLGQPTSSLSVWLAIAGVDEKNSLCLYPELFGRRLPLGGSQFLGSGMTLPKPTRLEISDGDLLVFSTDILHSSQLNISGTTRIALTTRIDPGTPVFSKESLWFVQRWYAADDVFAGRWRHKRVSAAEHSVAPPPMEPAARPSAMIPAEFRANEIFAVVPSDAIKENEKFAVEFRNIRIVILRSGGQLRAYSARCPHDGYHMDDGYHDDCVLFCPGHGLEFDVQTGRSKLNRYRLGMFKVSEKDGTVFLGEQPS